MYLNANTINNAYDALKANRASASEKSMIAADYKAVLEAEIAHFIASGEMVGSNDKERKAFLENKFAPGYADLRMKERHAELARVQVELAQIEVSRINALLRYMEFVTDNKEENHE
jgi:hypothetical protein